MLVWVGDMDSINDAPGAKSAQDEVARQFLQEAAQGSFKLEQQPLKLPNMIEIPKPVYGPVKEPDSAFQQSQRHMEEFRAKEQKWEPKRVNAQEFKDNVVDSVIPGFGRVQSNEGKWRLDYLDPRGCHTKAWVGLCFKKKLN